LKLFDQIYLRAAVATICLGNIATASAGDGLIGEVSGNLSLTSDYVFRGYTQTNEDPAVQGGLDWNSGEGFHVGVWGSTVNFKDSDEASTEFDLSAGFAGETEGFSYDIGFIYYLYPGADSALNYNFWEFYSSTDYDFGPAAISVGLAYTSDNFGSTGNGLYLQSGITVPLGEVVSINANLNYYDVDTSFGEDYVDWNIGGTISTKWLDASLTYLDTDITAGCQNVCESRIVFSISRSF
jgi:uncharacterized protein (TIGR02001 family)